MLGFIRGKVIRSERKKVLVENQGIGYWVGVSSNTVVKLTGMQEIELYLHHHVREDDESLYGFMSGEDQSFFEGLIKISGIGPKVALSIMDAGNLNEIRSAIQASDINFFTNIPGIGKKNATKVVLELKDKVSQGTFEDIDSRSDLYKGLESLGYSRPEIRGVISKIDGTQKLEDQLRQALRVIGE
jgi:holliday junction DNA helicase RuvA